MRWRGFSKRDVDQLLPRAFRDDMPADFEEQMRLRMRGLWMQASDAGSIRATGQDSSATLAGFFHALNLRRVLLATCALAMIISGSVLRAGHTSSFLTESFALRQTAFLVMSRLEHVRRMECHLLARDQQGRVVRYSISWVHERGSSVEMEGPSGKEVRFTPPLWMQTSVVSAPGQAGLNPPVGSRLQERWIEPIREFLSAPAVAGIITGPWQVAPSPGSDEKDRAAFFVAAPANPGLVRVVVDLRTYLPVSFEYFPAVSGAQILNSQPLVSAEFLWETRSASPTQH